MTNAEIVRNLHLPYGWRRDEPISLSLLLQDTGIEFVVASRTRPVALATNVAAEFSLSVRSSWHVSLTETFW